jgi:hypothetical protein
VLCWIPAGDERKGKIVPVDRGIVSDAGLYWKHMLRIQR